PREKVEEKTVAKQEVPESARAIEHYLRARLSELSGNYQQATYEMRKALLYDSSCLLHTELGRYYAMQGMWKRAVEQADRALDACGEFVPALLLKGMLLVSGNERQKAVEYFSRAVERDPKNIEAAIRLAQVYLDLGKKDAARKVLERMTRDNPASAEGFRRLGDLAFESGDEAAAERYYRRVLQLAPSDTRTIEVLAGLLERQGRYREAIAVFEDALVYSPENPSYMAYMGGLYLKAGDRESADAYFDQLRAMDPRNARLVAYEYSRLNMHKKAIAELVNLLENNPKMHSERLLLAIILEERKQWNKALEQLDRIPGTSRVYINALVNRGWCLLSMKRYAEAADVLEKALEAAARDEDRGRAWRYLA
ncbi:MAG: tetratricopeptide repeat protein, partial [Deltaproteobacteria bacterium]